MKNIIFIILIFPILISCSHDKQYSILSSTASNTQLINLNKALEQTVYNQSDIIDSIKKIVFLETNDSSLIHPPILKIVVSEDRIYILDIYQNMGVIIFDNNGKFIKRLPKGNGPKEIARIDDIAFDKKSKLLTIYGNPFVYIFDPDGNFLDVKSTSFSADHIFVTPDEYLFSKIPGHKNTEIDSNDEYAVIVTGKNLKIKHLMYHYASEENRGLHSGWINDDIYLTMPDCDTIFHYTNNILVAKYILDFTQYKTERIKTNDISKLKNAFTFDGSYLETENHQIITFSKGFYNYYLHRNKNTGHMIGGLDRSRIIEEEISINSPVTTFHNQFVSWNLPQSYAKGSLKSDKYISEADRQKLEALDEEDNPFLVFYTLKDF